MSDLGLTGYVLQQTTHFVRTWSDSHVDVVLDNGNYEVENMNAVIAQARKNGYELVRVFERDESLMYRFEGGDSE